MIKICRRPWEAIFLKLIKYYAGRKSDFHVRNELEHKPNTSCVSWLSSSPFLLEWSKQTQSDKSIRTKRMKMGTHVLRVHTCIWCVYKKERKLSLYGLVSWLWHPIKSYITLDKFKFLSRQLYQIHWRRVLTMKWTRQYSYEPTN